MSSLYSIETGGRLDPHLSQEWLLTNGLGGFASSTVPGCNSRRYHGLLVAATLPPVGRINALSRLGESLVLDGRTDAPHEFSVNRFRDNLYPRGDQYLRRFDLGDVARWEYEIDGVRVVKEAQLLWMRNVVGVRYTVESPDAARKLRLGLAPFLALRDFHAMRRAGDVRFDVAAGPRDVRVEDERHRARVWADAGRFEEAHDWWYGHVYSIETDRGQDDAEDLFTPGRFIVEGAGRLSVTVWADLEVRATIEPAAHAPRSAYAWDEELKRRRAAVASAATSTAAGVGASPNGAQSHSAPGEGLTRAVAAIPAGAETPAGVGAGVEGGTSLTVRRLVHAANDFIVYRKAPDGTDGTTVLAGYPGSPTGARHVHLAARAVPHHRPLRTQARQVLTVFASYVSEGMIPNRFDDYDNTPHYNTVDASLWFVHAAFEYLRSAATIKRSPPRCCPRATRSSTATAPAPASASAWTRPTG